jgi:hypothetical protein
VGQSYEHGKLPHAEHRPLHAATASSSRLLLLALAPIRSLLHRLLSDDDAARLLRVSEAAALSLLRGFTFHCHGFEGKNQRQMWRLKALCDKFDLRPTRRCLSTGLWAVRLEEASGRSPFPSSLTTLLLGPKPRGRDISRERPSIFGAEADVCRLHRQPLVSATRGAVRRADARYAVATASDAYLQVCLSFDRPLQLPIAARTSPSRLAPPSTRPTLRHSTAGRVHSLYR